MAKYNLIVMHFLLLNIIIICIQSAADAALPADAIIDSHSSIKELRVTLRFNDHYIRVTGSQLQEVDAQGQNPHSPEQQWIVHPIGYYPPIYVCKLQNVYHKLAAPGANKGYLRFDKSNNYNIDARGGIRSWTTLMAFITINPDSTINTIKFRSEPFGDKIQLGILESQQMTSRRYSDFQMELLGHNGEHGPIPIDVWKRFFPVIPDIAPNPPVEPVRLETHLIPFDGSLAYTATCPYCGGTIVVDINDERCGKFRHIVRENDGQLVCDDMHASRYDINRRISEGEISCGGPLRLVTDGHAKYFTTGQYTD